MAALAAGRHVLLEGPPGTGKSTLLSTLAGEAGLRFVLVEGSAELTPARLVGHHDPSRVLAEGYVDAVFVDGPLLSALRDGGLLYVEEINRIPEETLNVLVSVMSEGALQVPRLGRVEAADGFRLVAAMNPFDAVGTARISSAIYDRTCRVAMGYQSAAEEVDIVMRRSGADPAWAATAVELVRATRTHTDIRTGSSVRGAIDLVLVAEQLAGLRSTTPDSAEAGLDAALAALSGRIRLVEGCGRSAEDIVTELWDRVTGRPHHPAAPDPPGRDTTGATDTEPPGATRPDTGATRPDSATTRPDTPGASDEGKRRAPAGRRPGGG